MPREGLTAKQQRFVEEYLIDLNATQAAIRSGYSEKTAQEQSSRLLSKAIISEAVNAAQSKKSDSLGITTDWILDGLKTNFERAMQAVEVLDRKGNPTGEYEYQGSVANRALELLGKHRGMFSDKVELTGKDGGPVQLWTFGKRKVAF